MNKFIKKSIALTIATMVLGVAFSQTKSDTLKTDEVYIIKGYNPTISDAFKLNETPETKNSVIPAPEVKYSILNKQIKTGFEVEPIKAARMRGEPLTRLYKSHIKLGVGNYTTTFAEINLHNARSRKHSLGLNVKHLASSTTLSNRGFSGYSDNLVDLYGKKFLRKHLVSGGLDYTRNVVHFYGYDPVDFSSLNKDNTRQRYQRVGGNAGITSFYRDSTKVNHDIRIKYYYLEDLLNAKENNLQLDGDLNKYFGKELIKLSASVDYNHLSNISEYRGNAIVKFNPQIVSRGNRWRLDAGLGIYADAGQSTYFHFYPNAQFKYNVVGDMLIPYVGVTGRVQRNNLRSFSAENPYLISAVPVKNSNYKYDIYGGVRGMFGSEVSFNLRASKMKVENMPFFVNDTNFVVDNMFTVVYDDVAVVNLRGEVTYQKTEKLKLMLQGDYFAYDMTEELEPWHKPYFQATLSGSYDLKDKIVIRTDLFAISDRKAKTYVAENGENLVYGVYTKKLKGLIDANIGIEYRYNKRLSAFVNFNNIAGTRYYKWHQYPTQRFNVLGGLSYSF